MVQYVPLVLMALVGVIVFSLVVLAAGRKSAAASGSEPATSDGGVTVEQRGDSLLPVHVPVVALVSAIALVAAVVVLMWATDFRGLGGFGLAVILLFSVLTLSAVIYAIGAGSLEWGPLHIDDDDDDDDEPVSRVASSGSAATS